MIQDFLLFHIKLDFFSKISPKQHNYRLTNPLLGLKVRKSGRYVSQFLGFYVGGKFKREDGEISNGGIVGATYTLPLLIKADLRINTKGKLRFVLGNEHQLTDKISFDWRWNTEKEYTLGLSYAITKQLYISGNYDSRERFGLGLALRF